MSSNDSRDALSNMISCLRSTFKKYDRSTRKKAWKALQNHKEIDELLDSPSRPITGTARWLNFKEWLLKN